MTYPQAARTVGHTVRSSYWTSEMSASMRCRDVGAGEVGVGDFGAGEAGFGEAKRLVAWVEPLPARTWAAIDSAGRLSYSP